MLHLFGEVASEIYGNPKLEEGVSEEVGLIRKNIKYFMNVYEDKAKAYEAGKKVTEFVTGRSSVMSEFGPDSYQFSHRTFMEFFFSLYLDERNEAVKELMGVVLPHVKRHQWDVISHLALQIKTFRNQHRTLQALQLLRNVIKESMTEQLELVEV